MYFDPKVGMGLPKAIVTEIAFAVSIDLLGLPIHLKVWNPCLKIDQTGTISSSRC
jgi:hypothetical protein